MERNIKPLSIDKEARIPLHLIEQIRKSSALLFVGSGLSIPVGYPSWKNLISTIFKKIESTISIRDENNRKWLSENFFSNPDWVAEVISSASHDEYYNALRNIFLESNQKDVSLNHILISLLQFKGYLTTNYDTLIEDYLSIFCASNPDVYDYVEVLDNYAKFKNSSRYVLKLHGCVRKRAENIILTSTDYYRLLHDQRYIRLLAAIFSESIILCIGFSLRDRDFKFFLEERYHLYGRRCPPLYAIIPEKETCPLEISLLQSKYNVHILPISSHDNYAELTSFLFSLYCVVHREDSSAVGREFMDIALSRVQDSGKYRTSFHCETPKDEVTKAKRILSVFKEPVDVDAFIAVCMESGIRLSSATCIAMADTMNGNKISLTKPIPDITINDIKAVATWIAAELESIPVADSPRHFTSYHKALFGKYSKTLSYILHFKEGWLEIIGNDDNSIYRLTRINQYFKQEGMWQEWLDIAMKSQEFIDQSTDNYKTLMQSILWVYFWTRRYIDAEQLLKRHPELDEKKGEHNYTDRIRYMNKDFTDDLIKELENKDNLDYFGLSLLGRACARQYLMRGNNEKDSLIKAKKYLLLALDGATASGDWIERSVQSWYLSIVLSDLGEIDEAKKHLAEVRRLDENIMNRVPGIAWLDLAEYRMAIRNPEVSTFEKQELKDKAINSFKRLGVVGIEEYIDNEYYY